MAERNEQLHGDQPAAAAEAAYRDRKELAATAFERTRMPMVVTDAQKIDHPIVLANSAFLKLTGYSANEILGRNCRFLQGENTSPTAIAELRAAIAHEREASVELLNYRKDGSQFWNHLHLSPIHDDAGRLIYYFGSQIDKTEYRKVQSLEASEHRLLMEVDHRANNVLALVNSIVRLSKADDAARYASAVQQRVQALALAHAQLAARRWGDMPVGQLLRAQVEPYASRRVAMEGPEVVLVPGAVQPLALVVHELAVNAATHGSLSKTSGSLEIRWTDTPQDKGLDLHWIERGGAPPGPVRHRGFGTVIADALIGRQLGGSTDRDWSQQGLTVQLHLPNVLKLGHAGA